MDTATFGRMINAHLLSYFPDLRAYVAKMPASTRAAWAGLFEGTDPRDFRLACDDFAAGKERIPFNRDELAAKLLSATRVYRDARRDKERREGRTEALLAQADGPRRKKSSGDLGAGIIHTIEKIGGVECLKRITEREKAGENYQTVKKEEIDRYMRQFTRS